MARAHDLAVLGHSGVVYDGAQVPGGLLAGTLPNFRFPTPSMRVEAAAILARGVEFRGRTRISGARGLRSFLSLGYEAVFVAIGAPSPQRSPLGVDCRHTRVLDAMDFLACEVVVRGRVVVIGEGDLAADAAGVAQRRGRSADAECATTTGVVFSGSADRSEIPPETSVALLRDGIEIHDGVAA